MDVKEYLNELAGTAQLDEESKAALTKVLGNQKFAEELEKGVKRQSDYSRAMDEARTLKQQTEAQIGQWREWYNGAVENDAARERELQEYRSKAGVTTPTTVTPATTGITAKQLEEAQGRMVQIIKQMGKISSRHAADFHEALDVDAVEKIAVEKGLTVDKAYEEYVGPRLQERQQKEFDEKLKLAREEGLREGLTKRDIPDESTRAFHPIFGHAKAVEVAGKLTDGQRQANFAESWNTANKK